MRKVKVPIWIALPIVGAAVGACFALDDRRATEATSAKSAKVWSNEECLSCHLNDRVLKQMQDKRGDPTYCQAAYDALTKKSGIVGKSGKTGYEPK